MKEKRRRGKSGICKGQTEKDTHSGDGWGVRGQTERKSVSPKISLNEEALVYNVILNRGEKERGRRRWMKRGMGDIRYIYR